MISDESSSACGISRTRSAYSSSVTDPGASTAANPRSTSTFSETSPSPAITTHTARSPVRNSCGSPPRRSGRNAPYHASSISPPASIASGSIHNSPNIHAPPVVPTARSSGPSALTWKLRRTSLDTRRIVPADITARNGISPHANPSVNSRVSASKYVIHGSRNCSAAASAVAIPPATAAARHASDSSGVSGFAAKSGISTVPSAVCPTISRNVGTPSA